MNSSIKQLCLVLALFVASANASQGPEQHPVLERKVSNSSFDSNFLEMQPFNSPRSSLVSARLNGSLSDVLALYEADIKLEKDIVSRTNPFTETRPLVQEERTNIAPQPSWSSSICRACRCLRKS